MPAYIGREQSSANSTISNGFRIISEDVSIKEVAILYFEADDTTGQLLFRQLDDKYFVLGVGKLVKDEDIPPLLLEALILLRDQ